MSYFDAQRFAAMIKLQRGSRSLREVVRCIDGVSLSTLSRAERGRNVDVQTLVKICDWMNADLHDFIVSPTRQRPTTRIDFPDTMELLLRLLCTETRIDSAAIQAVGVILRQLYEQSTERGEKSGL